MPAILSDFYKADYGEQYIDVSICSMKQQYEALAKLRFRYIEKTVARSFDKHLTHFYMQKASQAGWQHASNPVTFYWIANNYGFFPNLAIKFPHL